MPQLSIYESEKLTQHTVPITTPVKNAFAYSAEYPRYLYFKTWLQITHHELTEFRQEIPKLEADAGYYSKGLVDAREALGQGYEVKSGDEGLSGGGVNLEKGAGMV